MAMWIKRSTTRLSRKRSWTVLFPKTKLADDEEDKAGSVTEGVKGGDKVEETAKWCMRKSLVIIFFAGYSFENVNMSRGNVTGRSSASALMASNHGNWGVSAAYYHTASLDTTSWINGVNLD
jgi:hypothetical protein